MNQATERDLRVLLGVEEHDSNGKKTKVPEKYVKVIDRAESLIAKRSRQSGLSIETLALCCVIAEAGTEAEADQRQESSDSKAEKDETQKKLTAEEIKDMLLDRAEKDPDFPHSKTEIHTANKSTLEQWLKE